MAGKGGGAWKVAYADFVTAMMAFFMVMWITGQNKPIKESIAKYFNDPFAGPSTRPNGSSFQRTEDNGDAPFNRGKARFGPGRGRGEGNTKRRTAQKERGKTANRPTLFTVHGGDRAHVGTVLLFPETSADLDDEGRAGLDEILPLLAGKPNKIEIRGHASARPLPSGSKYNSIWDLCYSRCLATMQFLRDRGIEPQRLRLSLAGSSEPQALEGDRHRFAENSRVEVYMLGEHVDDLRGSRPMQSAQDISPNDEQGSGSQHASAESQHGHHGESAAPATIH